MMRRYVWIGVIAVLVAGIGAANLWPTATAQDDRVVPIIARGAIYPEELSAEIGEPCRLIDHSLPGDRTPYQIVVEDQSGQVVAIHSLEGELALDNAGNKRCIADADIPIPDISVFTVSLGDQRIRGYTEADLPITVDDTIILVLD